MPFAHNKRLSLFQKNFVTILDLGTFWDGIDLLVLEKKILKPQPIFILSKLRPFQEVLAFK